MSAFVPSPILSPSWYGIDFRVLNSNRVEIVTLSEFETALVFPYQMEFNFTPSLLQQFLS